MSNRILLRPERESPEQRPPQGAYFLFLEDSGALTLRDWVGTETNYAAPTNATINAAIAEDAVATRLTLVPGVEGDRKLVDATDIASVDWDTRTAKDISGVTSVDWGSRQLMDDNVSIALDWATPGVLSFGAAAYDMGTTARAGFLTALGIPSYANDGAAGSGGLTTGQCYWNTTTTKVTAKT